MTSLTRQEFLSDPYTSLNHFIKLWRNPEIKSVYALLVKITESKSAALMFDRLLKLWKYSKNEKGVYKSWRDWQAECAISRSTSSRVHQNGSLKQAGIIHEVAQVAGKGTPMFYRLDWKAFVRALANLAGVSEEQVIDWMMGEGGEPDPDPEKQQTDEGRIQTPEHEAPTCAKDAQALTTTKDSQREITQENTPVVVVSDIFAEIPELEPKTTKKLAAKYGAAAVAAAAEYCRGKNPRSFGAYLCATLQNGWHESAPQQAAPRQAHRQETPRRYAPASKQANNPFAGLSWSDFAGNGEAGRLDPNPFAGMSWSDFADKGEYVAPQNSSSNGRRFSWMDEGLEKR